MQRDASTIESYRAALAAWHKQLEVLHSVLLDGESLGPPQLKGLLNREARAKERYDAERFKLLGIPPSPSPSTSGSDGTLSPERSE